MLEVLVWRYMTFAPVNPTFVVPTELPTESSPCCESLTTLPDMSIKVAASAREVLPYTWNRGMQTSLPFWTCARTTETKPIVPAICFMPCGCQIFSWSVSRPTEHGLSFAPTRLQDWPMSMAKNSDSSTTNTKRKVAHARPFRPSSFGLPFWIPKSRPELLTCCSRITPTPSPIRRTWEPFVAPTCARRLWSTLPLTRLPSATWPVSVFPSWL
mmetsp:Transcript_24718/g.37620  ORF Transcript_24718/g.37620 Transcript_24718/m.37620 type:complete len:213 (+) Transcript_24718:825-1463(+)